MKASAGQIPLDEFDFKDEEEQKRKSTKTSFVEQVCEGLYKKIPADRFRMD